MQRRSLVHGAGVAALLGGCGFQLRGTLTLPFQRLALSGFPARSTMAEQIVQALPAGTQAVADARSAQVVVQALEDRIDRTAAASTSAGQIREVRLRVRLRFRALAADGRVLRSETEFETTRDLSYSESAALAKEAEEAVLVRAMQADLAARVVKILAALDLTPPPAAAASAPGAAPAAASAPR